MKIKFYCLLIVALLLPMQSVAQNVTAAQLEKFQRLPSAQQQALARQYGIDLDDLKGTPDEPRPEHVQVVNPLPEKERDYSEEEADIAEGKKELKPFGYDLFAGSPSTFAPVTEIPVPATHILGPGDVIRVQLWGKENRKLELPISRDGTVSFPEHGPLALAGLSFNDAREHIRKLVAQRYIGVQSSVSMGELRSMRIFVLGEARKPGAYTVSSLSTISNALYVSGGIAKTGSLRRVLHKRNGELIGMLDLYQLLLKGDTSRDQRLQAGDVIFIPAVGDRVAIDGEVNRPAIYELLGETNLQQLVAMAGGLTAQAQPQITRITRTDRSYLRTMLTADLSLRSGQRTRLQAGDHVEVAAIAEATNNYVELIGAVSRAGRYAWRPGMRVSDLLPSLRGDVLPIADQHTAALVRTDLETDSISVKTLQLKQAIAQPGGASDVELQEKDQLLIFAARGKLTGEYAPPTESKDAEEREDKTPSDDVDSQYLELEVNGKLAQVHRYSRPALLAPVLKRLSLQSSPLTAEQTVHISGPVYEPGKYPLPDSGKLSDLFDLAGGLKDSAALYVGELARFSVADDGVGSTTIMQLKLDEEIAGRSTVRLQSRDRVLIKQIPEYARAYTVNLQGEVKFPGLYSFSPGETLANLLRRAGGLTDNAFPEGAIFKRAKLREREAQRLLEARKRLKGDLVGVKLNSGKALGGQSGIADVEKLLEQVDSARPVGRMVIDLPAVLAGDSPQPILLQDGDELIVPLRPQSVSVFGEVQFPTSHLYRQGFNAEDYLAHSGGMTRKADSDRVYVIKADGSVVLPRSSRWFLGSQQKIDVGDTIVVPIDVDRLNKLDLLSNVSQIFYQIALGAAAVGNL